MHRILLLFAATFLFTSDAAAFDAPDGKWERLDVDGIVVFTDAGARRATEIARHLGALRRTLGAFDMVDVESGREVRLYVFKNRERFVPYLPRYEGRVAQVAGYTSYSDTAIQMAVQAHYRRPPDSTEYDGYLDAFDVLSHEYVHAYLGEHAPRTPTWLGEGLAEFFSTYRIDGDRVVIGGPCYRHVKFLGDQQRNLSLSRLLMLERDDPEYNESNRNGFVYAQAWATTHYLMTDRDRRAALRQFLLDVHDGMPELAAVNRDLLAHLPAQGPQLREYVTQDHLPYFRVPLKDDFADGEVLKSDLDDATLLVRLGELVTGLGPGSYDSAQEHFRAALELDPDRTEARVGLARVEVYRDDYEAAIVQLEAVVTDDPEDCAASGMLGYALIRQHESDRGEEAWTREAETPEPVLRARAVLERSCRGDGVRPWAHYALARSYLGEEDPTPGIEALVRAVDAAPWEPRFVELMVVLQCNAGDLESARRTFDEQFRPRVVPADRRQAETYLVTKEFAAALDLHRDGEAEAAAMLLVRAFEMTESEAIRSAVLEQTRRLRLAAAYEQYLAAVRLSRDGEFDAALTALGEIDVPVEDLALRERVTGMREELESLVSADLGR